MSRLSGWLPQARWKRWLIFTALAGFLLFVGLIALILTAVLLWRNTNLQGWVMVTILRHQSHEPVIMPPVPHLSTQEAALLSTNALSLQSAAELFQPTNVWDVQLVFTSNQWTGLAPKIVPPVAGLMRPDGSIVLRNPKASRNGLAGVFGLDLPWSEGDLRFGNASFHDVAARFKGNGTFVDSQRSYKRPFKFELNKHGKGQELAGRATLNFHNLTADVSCLKDTLAYEFFREAGVPASRTAFARLRLTIQGRMDDRLLGLYLLVENPDATWARERFGLEGGVALFKPVTYELFKDLGDDWASYEGIYDPKTKLKPGQAQRVVALAKLLTHATDADFAARIGQFIDLDEFARFLACQVLLSNYDGPLSNGQNFLLYLDPRTELLGFIPWDLDHSWGEFSFIGSLAQREHASIWHPWVGENRFLERMLAVPDLRARYRRQLERLCATLFVPDRLNRRVDELAPIVRPFIREESTARLRRFEREVADSAVETPDQNAKSSSNRPGYSLKRFFAARAESISQQLDGHVQGVILTRRR